MAGLAGGATGGLRPVVRHAAPRSCPRCVDRVVGAARAGRCSVPAVRGLVLRPRVHRIRRRPVRGRLRTRDARGGARAVPGGSMGVRRDAPDALDVPGRSGPRRADRDDVVLRPHAVRRVRRRRRADLRGAPPDAR